MYIYDLVNLWCNQNRTYWSFIWVCLNCLIALSNTLVSSLLDYYNSLLTGVNKGYVNELVQNCLAWAITKAAKWHPHSFIALTDHLLWPLSVSASEVSSRGVQYVHCMMHKCIMVKVGGNEKHVKHVKKHINLMKLGEMYESRGSEKCFEIGGNVSI